MCLCAVPKTLARRLSYNVVPPWRVSMGRPSNASGKGSGKRHDASGDKEKWAKLGKDWECKHCGCKKNWIIRGACMHCHQMRRAPAPPAKGEQRPNGPKAKNEPKGPTLQQWKGNEPHDNELLKGWAPSWNFVSTPFSSYHGC